MPSQTDSLISAVKSADTIIDTAKTIGLSWTSVVIISLTVVIIILSWLLVRREKALQLMGFSITPLGLKLTYELNKDEKMQTLALENIALQNEVKALKTTVKKERWHSIGLVIMMIIILILSRFKFSPSNKSDDTKLLNPPDDKDKQ